MSRWFRHYAGMMRDDKLVRAAMKSKQSVERVTWVWGAILESAAEIDDGGRYEIDHDEIAYFLRCEASDISAIEVALAELNRIDGKTVSKWAERQFQSDRSADRTKKWRDKNKTPRDDDVTSQERLCDSPDTETDTEEKKEKSAVAVAPASPSRKPKLEEVYHPSFGVLWDCFPKHPNSSKRKAYLAWTKLTDAQKDLCLDGVSPFIADIEQKRKRWPEFMPCHLSTYVNERRWESLLEVAA